MSEEELININGIREDLYQTMQIGDITLNSKHSQELYDFMNYQDKEIERLNNIIKKIEKMFNHETLIKYYYGMSYEFEINDFKDDIFEIIKGSDKE